MMFREFVAETFDQTSEFNKNGQRSVQDERDACSRGKGQDDEEENTSKSGEEETENENNRSKQRQQHSH